MLQNDTPGFTERFAYVIWLRAAGRPYSETDNEIADGAHVTRQWLQKWRRMNRAPNERIMTRNLVRFLEQPYGWSVEGWLLDGEGIPPRPELWTVWVAAKAQLTQTDQPKRRTKHDIPESPMTMPAVTRATIQKGKGRRRQA
jgi:hypothetical protein